MLWPAVSTAAFRLIVWMDCGPNRPTSRRNHPSGAVPGGNSNSLTSAASMRLAGLLAVRAPVVTVAAFTAENVLTTCANGSPVALTLKRATGVQTICSADFVPPAAIEMVTEPEVFAAVAR